MTYPNIIGLWLVQALGSHLCSHLHLIGASDSSRSINRLVIGSTRQIALVHSTLGVVHATHLGIFLISTHVKSQILVLATCSDSRFVQADMMRVSHASLWLRKVHIELFESVLLPRVRLSRLIVHFVIQA